MFKKPINMFATAAVSASLVISGCATTSGEAQDQAGGAVLGAALGCGVGALITRNARGCAVGAAMGAVAGWSAVKISQYQAKQVRSAQADARLYGLTKPVDSPQVRIRSGASSPTSVRPGAPIQMKTDYSVLLPASQSVASVDESWTLKKDGKVLYAIPAVAKQRTDGGWIANATIDVPTNAVPGTYVIEYKVKSGSSYDTQQSSFVVKS